MSALTSDALNSTPPVLADWQQIGGFNGSLTISSDAPGARNFWIKAVVTSAVLSDSGPTDNDGDGVEDAIGAGPVKFADTRSPATTGSIVDKAGLSVLVADASNAAQGVVITVGPGTGYASFSVCGFPVLLSANSSTVITCGSIGLIVNQGTARVNLGNDTFVEIGVGGVAKISQTPEGPYSVENLGSNQQVTITRNNSTTIVDQTTPYSVGQRVTGFFSPVIMNEVNVAKAGSAIPLKFQLFNVPEGTPVNNLTSVALQIQPLDCLQGGVISQLEEVASGSGLQNLGGGNYQFNWKTPKGYANTCKGLVLDLGGGLHTFPAYFGFK